MQNDQSDDLSPFLRAALRLLQKPVEIDWFRKARVAQEERLARRYTLTSWIAGIGGILFGLLCLTFAGVILYGPILDMTEDIVAYLIAGAASIGIGALIISRR